MASQVENTVARSLRAVLAALPDGANIDDSDEFQTLLSGLEYFLPAVLGEVHQEWKGQGLDGFLFGLKRKMGPGEAEFFGMCIFISDQTLTPIHLRLRVAAASDEVEWLECSVGKPGDGKGGMMRVPYNSTKGGLLCTPDSIPWVYRVGFGDEHPNQKTDFND